MKTTDQKCDRPPQGWECSRGKGHEGPCAATATKENGSALEALLSELPKFHPAKAEYADLCMQLGEAQADSECLDAVQDYGASWDIYAEPDGKWSIREEHGERSIFDNLRECASAIRNAEDNRGRTA